MFTKMNPVDCHTNFSEVEPVFYSFLKRLILLSFKFEHLLQNRYFLNNF